MFSSMPALNCSTVCVHSTCDDLWCGKLGRAALLCEALAEGGGDSSQACISTQQPGVIALSAMLGPKRSLG